MFTNNDPLKHRSGQEERIRVLATDFETFSIEYSCTDSNLIKRIGKHKYKVKFSNFQTRNVDQIYISCKRLNRLGSPNIYH